jgi:transcription elongation factor GreB
MSKAFTKEDDREDDEAEDAGPALPPGSRNYFTPVGFARLKAELEQLLRVERPEVVRVVSWAAGNGDRSENGDYIYGKRRLREIDRRIRYLTKRLGNAEVVDPAARRRTDQVFFGAHVTYEDAQGDPHTVQIVGVDEAEPDVGRISWVSPLGKALLRLRVGDSAVVRAPRGDEEIVVTAVRYGDGAPP